jgi:hypothetical protein
LYVQSATFSSGVAQAVFMNPSFIFTSIKQKKGAENSTLACMIQVYTKIYELSSPFFLDRYPLL